MLTMKFTAILALSLFVSGCAPVLKENESKVAEIMKKRIGKEISWNNTCYADPRIECFIQELVSCPIDVESAVQIALLNNPEVQAIFEDIGIAQADLVEAGLFTNPAFSIELRYPYEKKFVPNIEYLITAAFLDIFLIPLRTKLAKTELEQTHLKVSIKILNLSFEVKETYYELVAQQHLLKYTQKIAELTDIQREITLRQYQAGNVYQLDLSIIQAALLETNLEIIKSEEELIRLQEKLNRLLGFKEDICLLFPDKFPEKINNQNFDLCMLESTALQERIDLKIARFEIFKFKNMLGLKSPWTYSNLQAGVAGERDPDGVNLIGPGFSGEFPVFNYGQGVRMRIFAEMRQAKNLLEALEIRVLSEVRESYKILMKQVGTINKYQTEIIPLQNKILNSSVELYNVMGLGIDRLLINKIRKIEIDRNYVKNLKSYWIANVRLDQALGGYLFQLCPQELTDKGIQN